MITINVKTRAVQNAREHEPQIYSKSWRGLNITNGYIRGDIEPNYPMPAIRRRVNYASLWSVLRWIGFLPSGYPRF